MVIIRKSASMHIALSYSFSSPLALAAVAMSLKKSIAALHDWSGVFALPQSQYRECHIEG